MIRKPGWFLAAASLLTCSLTAAGCHSRPSAAATNRGPAGKLKHIVVIYQENASFDHYFGIYPKAANPPGEPPFHALPNTPKVDGFTQALLTRNPNSRNKANGKAAANPFRLDRTQAYTEDQDHEYRPEQRAFDHGKMDLFPKYTGSRDLPPELKKLPPASPEMNTMKTPGMVMGYFDGNTVTALWNYAQHYALSDHTFGTTFGPSTLGAINLVSGQTNGVVQTLNGHSGIVAGGAGSLTDTVDPQPIGDLCSDPTGQQMRMGGRNVGDLLDQAGVSWGWFSGGFNLSAVNPNGTTGCRRSHQSRISGVTNTDYEPHYEPFQFYAATANPKHLRPTSVAMIGKNGDRANHQYGVQDFFDAIKAGDFPAVSFLKAAVWQNGHPGASNPLDAQHFVVKVINFLERQPEWNSTAVIIAWDDSDGWYDHLPGPIVNGSSSPLDALNGPGKCGDGVPTLPGIDPKNRHAEGRCGYGPRLPLLVVSPWAKANYVSHVVTDQTSILRLIEDTFLHGERIGQGSFDSISGSLDGMFDFRHATPRNTQKVILNPITGELVSQ